MGYHVFRRSSTLRSAIACDGSTLVEVNSCVIAAWSKWRFLTGVLCNKKIPERYKSKIYRAVVRPIAIYGAECWPVTKEIERRLSIMEKMLNGNDDAAVDGWSYALARGCNDSGRQRFGVTLIFEEMRKSHLRWYRHIPRAKGEFV